MTRTALALLLACSPMAALAQETTTTTATETAATTAAPETPTDVATTETPPTTVAPTVTETPAAMAAEPELPTGAEMTLGALRERSEDEVRAKLGEPAVARREEGGAMWTYRLQACALYVYFRAAGREGLRVSGVATGPRHRGDIAPGVDACLAAVAAT